VWQRVRPRAEEEVGVDGAIAKMLRWGLPAVAAVFLAVLGAVVYSVRAVRSTWQHRQQVADQVLAGKLRPDAAGIVTLPPQCRGMTEDGKLYVTRQPGGGTWILFVCWRGKGSNLEGYLFTSPSQFFDIGSGPTARIVVPTVPPAGLSKIEEVQVEEPARPGWYRVSCSMD
jgi:hypothetical protein